MRMITVPGFKELFPDLSVSYEELLADIPRDTTIVLISVLNNELNGPEKDHVTQQRLRELISFRFSAEQRVLLDKAYSNYRKRNSFYDGSVFGRRYLLAMLIKEIKRNRAGKEVHDTPGHEFNFLMAYLKVIDEVNQADSMNFPLNLDRDDPLRDYKILWPPNINQFEFNDFQNAPFGIVKLFSFCKYAYHNLKPYLKEYLEASNFKNISQFVSSYYQISSSMSLPAKLLCAGRGLIGVHCFLPSSSSA
jgi:hypothetical protein